VAEQPEMLQKVTATVEDDPDAIFRASTYTGRANRASEAEARIAAIMADYRRGDTKSPEKAAEKVTAATNEMTLKNEKRTQEMKADDDVRPSLSRSRGGSAPLLDRALEAEAQEDRAKLFEMKSDLTRGRTVYSTATVATQKLTPEGQLFSDQLRVEKCDRRVDQYTPEWAISGKAKLELYGEDGRMGLNHKGPWSRPAEKESNALAQLEAEFARMRIPSMLSSAKERIGELDVELEKMEQDEGLPQREVRLPKSRPSEYEPEKKIPTLHDVLFSKPKGLDEYDLLRTHHYSSSDSGQQRI